MTTAPPDREDQAAERLAAGPLWSGNWNLVFATEIGTPLSPDTPTNLMAKLVRRAELPHARLHDLRHLHATKRSSPVCPKHVVAARLGHADPAITFRVYAHVLREQAAGLAEVCAGVIEAS